MVAHCSLDTEYWLEYFRSFEGFQLERRLSAEGLNKELAKSPYTNTQLKRDIDAIKLLQKIRQRHGVPFEIRLAIEDVGPRPNYEGTGLDSSAWVQIGEWMGLSHDQNIELRQRYKEDWRQACEDYLKTLQPTPERASTVYEQLLPHAEKYRFKTALTSFMRSSGAYHWTADGLLILRKNEAAVYFPQKDMFYLNFLGELFFQGPSLLENAVEGRIKKALRQVDWHDRILDRLQETGIFVQLKRKVHCANCEIDAVGVGQPFARVAPDSMFVLEATPILNYDAFGQVEWYQHVFASQSRAQPYKGIVCERITNQEFLNFCRQRGVAVFLVSYTGVDVYESQ